MIKIECENETYNVYDKEVSMVLNVTVDLKKSLEDDYSRDKRSIEDRIMRTISEKVTSKYLEKFTDEIIEKIDIETLVKRVQLAVVQNLGNVR